MDDFYRDNLLEHAHRPHNWSPPDRRLARVDLEYHELNPLCGDDLTVTLALGPDERIADVRFEGSGCAIAVAAASMASDAIKGRRVSEIPTLDRSFITDLLGIEISAMRMRCALLSLKVLQGAARGGGRPGSP